MEISYLYTFVPTNAIHIQLHLLKEVILWSKDRGRNIYSSDFKSETDSFKH